MSSRVMLLVDFDNVSTEVIEQAFEIARQDYGAVHVRRAYCTAEQAHGQASFMKRLGLRPMVNLAVGKNSTDIALAVDAMDLVIAERPTVVVIVSSDSDYTPLVGRLREKGAWVRGFGQQGKTGDGVPAAYDQFTDLAHRDAKAHARGGPQAPAPTQARQARAAQTRGGGSSGTRARKPAPALALAPQAAPVAAPLQAPAPAPAPARMPTPSPPPPAPVPQAEPPVLAAPAEPAAVKPARKTASRKKAAAAAASTTAALAAPPAAPAFPPEVEAILQALPSLRRGDKVELGEAAQALRQAGLLAKTAPSTKLFKKHQAHFLLSPERQPNKVQFTAAERG
ncbi:MAG: NYN domain-containing protein [Burkholderiaceae bacterium]